MKIIHTADLHLGHVFHQHTRTAEHRHFLHWLQQTIAAEQADALIVSGDIFDTHNPSAEAQRLFFDFLIDTVEANEGLQVVVTAGNHDSGARLEAAAELLRRHNIYVRGTITRDADNQPDFEQLILPLSPRGTNEAAVVCYALPYLRPYDYASGLSAAEGLKHYLQQLDQRLKKSDFRRLPIVVAAHFYATGAEIASGEHSERLVVGGEDAIDAAVIGRDYSYVALGHIHKAQSVGGRDNICYAGSPLPLSFSERQYRHGVMCVEIDENGREQHRAIAYQPLATLLSVPERGAGKPEEVKQLLSDLPTADQQPDRSRWPYLEVNLQLSQPEPNLRHELFELVRNKAVRLCRITTGTARQHTSTPLKQLPTLEGSLSRLSPFDIAQKFYTDRYGTPMTSQLAERFHQAEQMAEHPEGQQPTSSSHL